ncbi:signal recognition particle subunit FFH/SRP54 (srp54) [Jejuia pallidilutea]|uniref:Signal recognition particle subunit FFH/SRP54 (Srp54) n=1 Tax=Jejuia pallidilutea TaxID=504487 RepID=A0A362XEI9_9FLAO|nr:AAA family ATPase [Jejuia pallidilutea]PQV50280.1 signal recognition particle subunit FFH/SRP54 (srp54) [Jejuia pallidilutea]
MNIKNVHPFFMEFIQVKLNNHKQQLLIILNTQIMELKKSQRERVKLRIGISGASGFGKTHSALLLAYGMTNDWSKIALIDSENSSGSLYSHLGNYNTLDLSAPFSPERYIKAIKVCEDAGMEVIIIDSVSPEWSGTGGCLQIHEQLGGRFQDWMPVKKRHQAFIDSILQSKCHIITTTRRKIDYSLDIGSNGKSKVVKHGTKEITADGYEYELTLNFELINDNHLVRASKDRTGLYMNKSEFVITSKIGRQLLDWCNQGSISQNEVESRINECLSISELMKLYKEFPQFQQTLNSQFQSKKQQLENLVKPSNFSSNGINKS